MNRVPASLHDYGELLLASRLRRLSEMMYAGVDAVYREQGVTLSSSCFPILFLLRDCGRLGISQLASQLGQSHPAVSQMSRKLLKARVVREWPDPADERRRLLSLSSRGRALMRRLGPVWHAISRAVQHLEGGRALSASLAGIDQSLTQQSFARRIRAQLHASEASNIRILPFEARYARAFKRLNLEWLRRYFRVEPVDKRVLSRPSAILRKGGAVLLAQKGAEIVGTCALLKVSTGRFELSKMAVTEVYQGLGIGRRLLLAALEVFADLGGDELYLETNSILAPAIKLYESVGFVHAPRPAGPAHYVRADVYMRYKGAP